MTFWEMIRQVILGPIDLLLDVVFSFGMQLSGNPAVAIVVLSLAVNLLVLPLYLRADAPQMEENYLRIAVRNTEENDRLLSALTMELCQGGRV